MVRRRHVLSPVRLQTMQRDVVGVVRVVGVVVRTWLLIGGTVVLLKRARDGLGVARRHVDVGGLLRALDHLEEEDC